MLRRREESRGGASRSGRDVTCNLPARRSLRDPSPAPPHVSPTKKIFIALGIATLVMIILAVVLGGGNDGTEVETAEARVRAITETVTASGQVNPDIDVAIASDVSGEIVVLAVEEGDRVEKGQLLLRIRPDFYASQTEQAQAGVAQAQSGIGEARGGVGEAQAAVGEAQAAVAEARAGVEQARREAGQATAERERAERALARQQDLYDRDVVSAMDLEAARGAAEVARAAETAALGRIRAAEGQVSVAQSRVASAQQRVRSSSQRVQSARAQAQGAQAQARQSAQQLAQTAIYSPITGTVSKLNVELGERVVGTAQMQGTELMRIARLDAMTLEADINENDVVRIQIGDSARVEIDAYPDEPLVGRVSQIANSARVEGAGTAQAVTNFPVEIRITGAGGNATRTVQASADEGSAPRGPVLRPGMSGTVDVFTRGVPRAVVVPIQAVAVRDFNELKREQLRKDGADRDEIEAVPDEEDLRRVVFVVEGDEVAMREVTTGIADDTHIEVKSGLAGGERVVTGPFAILRTELEDGDAVWEED